LLGRHVAWRPDEHLGDGSVWIVGLDELGDREIEQGRLDAGRRVDEENVRGFDVSMDDHVLVAGVNALADGHDDVHGLVDGMTPPFPDFFRWRISAARSRPSRYSMAI